LIYLSNYKGSVFIVKKEELMGEVINIFCELRTLNFELRKNSEVLRFKKKSCHLLIAAPFNL
jgi:hypothetical protein